jgi:hypothetical protein
MAWEASETTYSVAQDAASVLIELAPKEIAHIQVERTDAGTDDRIRVIVQTSTDGGTTWDTEPLFQMEVRAAASTIQPMLVQGPKAFRIRIENATTPQTESITTDIHVVKDGGLA